MKHRSAVFGRRWGTVCLFAGVVACLLLAPGPRASGGRIPIFRAGTISSPGSYYLTRDIGAVAGTVLNITSNDVTIDFNGHFILHTGTAATDILVNCYNYTNIRITNGQLLGGYHAVSFYADGVAGGASFRVDHVQISAPRSRGIYIGGVSSFRAHAVVEDNVVQYAHGDAGIYLEYADDAVVKGNVVRDVLGANGVYMIHCRRSEVAGNTVTRCVTDGIVAELCSEVNLRENTCGRNTGVGISLRTSDCCSADGNVLAGNATGLGIYGGSGNEYGFNHAPHGAGGTGFDISPPGSATNGGGNYE